MFDRFCWCVYTVEGSFVVKSNEVTKVGRPCRCSLGIWGSQHAYAKQVDLYE